MRSLSMLIAAAAAGALSACATPPADPAAPGRLAATAEAARAQVPAAERDQALAGAQPMTNLSDQQYMMMAAASDLFEIQSSQLALQRSQTPMTRQYAQMLIEHHTTSTQALVQQAKLAGLTPPPPKLMPEQEAMLSRLKAAGSGAAFDKAYFTEQVPAHRMAWQIHQGYATAGQTPQLKTAAATSVPVVEQHLVEAARHASM